MTDYQGLIDTLTADLAAATRRAEIAEADVRYHERTHAANVAVIQHLDRLRRVAEDDADRLAQRLVKRMGQLGVDLVDDPAWAAHEDALAARSDTEGKP